MTDARQLPADPDSTASLAERGLRYGLVDTADTAAFTAWLEADERGFHGPRPFGPMLQAQLSGLAYRRTTAVWDERRHRPEVPVATVSSWITELTVSPRRSVPAWAISSVTVAPTHRRRGIARALLEGELRTARAAGVPLAMLTVTEATIYGRYGFSPAASALPLTVERSRVSWSGPTTPGLVQFVEPAELRDSIEGITDRAVFRRTGDVRRWPAVFDLMLGLVEPDSEWSRGVRVARYDDADGTPQGYAIYRIARTPPALGRLELEQLVAASDDAERALWRFLIEHDYIGEIRAPLRSTDEPLPWMLDDPRAVTTGDARDHLWLRVIDPVASLAARRYSSPGELLLNVTDPYGFATGVFRLVVGEGGEALVEPAAAGWDDAVPTLRLGVRELGSILLGGVRPSLLAVAGRVEADERPTLGLADRMFAAERSPYLSFWF